MQDWYLQTLKRLFAPERALKIYVALHRWAGLTVATLVLVVLFVAAFVYIRPVPTKHVAFHLAGVRGLLPVVSEHGPQKSIIDARLPDDRPVRLLARNKQLTGILDEICVEERRYLRSDSRFFRAKPLSKCQRAANEKSRP